MSFGAIIAVQKGPVWVPVDFGIECALTEVRVEQSIDEQTTFALRFQEDYENDKPTVTEHELFKSPIELAILVPKGPRSKELICLVRGQIEQIEFDVAHGGPGSSFEARGRDVRTILDRVCAPESLIGLTSDTLILQLIAGVSDFIPALEPGVTLYDGLDGHPTLNHVGTSLELIENLAKWENQCVWLSYK
ncbi:MAG TPA: hypothetical protein VK034_25185, partial [Enhygromyxa sp.]|nr:hypothetical protein [Enhygromyxa sp.]